MCGGDYFSSRKSIINRVSEADSSILMLNAGGEMVLRMLSEIN